MRRLINHAFAACYDRYKGTMLNFRAFFVHDNYNVFCPSYPCNKLLTAEYRPGDSCAFLAIEPTNNHTILNLATRFFSFQVSSTWVPVFHAAD